ncbi:MAG: hypothetical protein Q8R28_07920 [Dehalococcoidia bacterium]|nr:hypothetical protein [Dehalococcoidia bacterium]
MVLQPVVPTNICGVPVSAFVRARLDPSTISELFIPTADLPVGVTLAEYQLLLAAGILVDTFTLQFPTRIQFATFPVDGSFAALPAGQTLIELSSGLVTNAVGNSNMVNDQEILSQIRSLSVVADGPLEVRMEPNVGAFQVLDGTPLVGSGKRVGRIVLDAGDNPVLARVAMSTSVQAPSLGGLTQAQHRFADQVLTKSSGAATEDGLAALSFVPRWRDTTIPASLGANFLRTEHVGQKVFLVRNIGAGAIEVLLQGTHFVSVGDARGYIPDPDMGAARVTIASGDTHVIESGVLYGAVQFAAAVAAAETAGATARVIVEYKGITYTR